MLGPHFAYDLVRLARRGRSAAVRVLYVAALLGALALVDAEPEQGQLINDYALKAQRFAIPVLAMQYLMVVVLAPAYFGTALVQEKERGTLELLFTTHLSDWEIVLG